MKFVKKAVKAKDLEGFEKYLQSENQREITVKKYMRDAGIFLNYLGDRKIEEAVLSEYKAELLNKYAQTSVKAMLFAINKYLEYCGTDLRIDHSDVSGKSANMEKRALTANEYARLISAARTCGDERLYMALETICSAGLQYSQLKYITVEAVENSCAVVESHGKRKRIYLPAALCRKLRNYCRKKKIEHGMIFVTRNGNPIDRSNLAHQMRRLCETAEVDESKIFLQNLKSLYSRTYMDMSREILDRMGLVESAE